MVPTALGASLLDLFDHDASVGDVVSPAMLSHPSIRRQMEEEVKEIAMGNIDKEYCLEKNLSWFEERYAELERSLTRDRVGEFGKSLVTTKIHVKGLEKLGAFEPKVAAANGKQQPRKKGNRKGYSSRRPSYGKQQGKRGQNQKRRSKVKQ